MNNVHARVPLVLLSAALFAAPAAADENVWFHDITEQAGLDASIPTDPYSSYAVPDVMTAGCAFLDYDRDGDLDILLTNATAVFDASGRLAQAGVRLYRQDGPARFTDVTKSSGIGHSGYGIGVAVGDYDNDGFPDIYFANYQQDYLFRNRGDGTFENVTLRSEIELDGWSCSSSFFDYDGDGFLDLFVTQYVFYEPSKRCTDAGGRPQFCGPRAFPPAPDHLLRNRGDGTFEDVSARAGIGAEPAAGLGVITLDLNDDGLQDVYVTNDSYANHLWLNQGDGTFLDDAIILGAAVNEHGKPEAGMGVVAADFDGDLDFDLFMTHLRKESNTFYRNIGGSMGFEDVTSAVGLGNASMPYTGFGTVALDLELDGDLDLIVANGAVNRGPPIDGVDLPVPWRYLAEPNQMFVNDGTGHFAEPTFGTDGLTTRVEMTRGLATGDIDGDGDLDLLLANAHSPARLYRNDAPNAGHWLSVRAIEPATHRDAIGASVEVRLGDRRIIRRIASATSYLSSQEPTAHFGLGEAADVDALVVRWPDGAVEHFPGVAADQSIELHRGNGQVLP